LETRGRNNRCWFEERSEMHMLFCVWNPAPLQTWLHGGRGLLSLCSSLILADVAGSANTNRDENSHKMENHLQNHSRGKICPVLTVGWPMLSGFVVEG